MKAKIPKLIGPLLALVMVALALRLLYGEMGNHSWSEVVQGFRSIPRSALALAVGLTAVNYALLPGYDLLATRFLGQRLPSRRIALVGVIGSAATHNLGTFFGGTAVRYRLYSSWGLSAREIVKIIGVAGLTFWLGLAALASVVFLVSPLPAPPGWRLPVATVRPVGAMLLASTLGYLMWSAVGQTAWQWRGWELKPPRLTFSLAQVCLGAIDTVVAASVLYVLLPAEAAPSFLHFLAVYLLAIVAIALTQAPGGLGVFEATVLMLLAPPSAVVVAGPLLAFRAIYYLLPMTAAAALFATTEAAALRRAAKPS
jgi:phosphatidylglycerol lysyltransferase